MKFRVILLLLAMLTCITAAVSAITYYQQSSATREHKAFALADQAAELIAGSLDNSLDNYQEVVVAVSRLPEIRNFYLSNTEQNIQDARSVLDILCHAVNGSVCYLLNLEGTLVENNQGSDTYNLKGRNFAFRPYFKNALRVNSEVYLAKGVATSKRGIYFSHRVDDLNGQALGVAVIKLPPEALGLEFTGFNDTAMLVAPDGVIFASNQEQWVLKSLTHLTAEERAALLRTRQFGDETSYSLGFMQKDRLLIGLDNKRYISGSAPVPSLRGWSIKYLLDESDIVDNKEVGLAVYGFAVLAAFMLAVVFVLYRLGLQDLARRRNAEKALIESESRLRRLTELSSEAIIIHSNKGTIVDTNGASEDLFGYTREELIGKEIWALFSQSCIDTARNYVKDRYDLPFEVEGIRQNGQIFPLEIIAKESSQDGKKISVSCFRDISKRKDQEAHIRHLALYDGLTQLPNRNHMLEQLDQAIAESDTDSTSLHLMFIDLDDFKKINDTLGHAAGDRLLVAVAARMRQLVDEDELLARYGGDEFLVLIRDDSEERVARLASQVLQALRQPFVLDTNTFYISGSVGIARYPDHACNASELLQKADTAMYSSKDRGRNTFNFFEPDMNRHIAERVQIEQHLRGALGRDELYVEYQPMFSAETGDLVAAEALVRWHSPILGRVGPDKFIPVAEDTGLIEEIGCWVLEQACVHASAWMRRGIKPFYISVNLSPKQFRDPNLISNVQSILFQTELPPESLFFEITEGVLVKNDQTTQQVMMSLAKIGIGLAMDDFGTGYSSLSYLKRFPFNTLKIDREFVRDLESDPNDQQLIVATIAMAKGLGLRVVAEGVENEAQMEYLREAGCHYLQGYLLSRPISAQVFEESYVRETPKDPLDEVLYS